MIDYFKEKGVIDKIPNDTHILVKYKTTNGTTEASVNSPFDDSLLPSIVKYIDGLGYEKIVLACRSEKEPYGTTCPTTSQVETLKNTLKTQSYVYFQEPWPAPIPKFNHPIVRFGFDQGCALDALLVDDFRFSAKLADDEIFIFINNTSHHLLASTP